MSSRTRLRSLYRSILRELPPLKQSVTPLHTQLRNSFTSAAPTVRAPVSTEQTEQFLVYLRSQRMYATLLERYNPSLGMDTAERVRLSARRVGLNLPGGLEGKK